MMSIYSTFSPYEDLSSIISIDEIESDRIVVVIPGSVEWYVVFDHTISINYFHLLSVLV